MEYQKRKNKSDWPSHVRAYTDGSFNTFDKCRITGYGFVIIDDSDNIIESLCDSITDPLLLNMRNVSGEIIAVIKAIQSAMAHNCESIDIYYDYIGIGKWAYGKWKRNTNLSNEYYNFIQSNKRYIKISFYKIKSHTGDKWNDVADRLAKEGCYKAINRS